jgi:hypothetical protein
MSATIAPIRILAVDDHPVVRQGITVIRSGTSICDATHPEGAGWLSAHRFRFAPTGRALF